MARISLIRDCRDNRYAVSPFHNTLHPAEASDNQVLSQISRNVGRTVYRFTTFPCHSARCGKLGGFFLEKKKRKKRNKKSDPLISTVTKLCTDWDDNKPTYCSPRFGCNILTTEHDVIVSALLCRECGKCLMQKDGRLFILPCLLLLPFSIKLTVAALFCLEFQTGSLDFGVGAKAYGSTMARPAGCILLCPVAAVIACHERRAGCTPSSPRHPKTRNSRHRPIHRCNRHRTHRLKTRARGPIMN